MLGVVEAVVVGVAPFCSGAICSCLFEFSAEAVVCPLCG